MIIIIDGYNFLKSITGSTFISDQAINDWIGTFQEYVEYRGNQIIVVFDAGPSFYPSSEWHGSVQVLYAGQDQTADDVIKKWLARHQGLDVLLVSSDREIRSCAESLRLTSISSQDFNKVFVQVMHHEQRQQVVFEQTMHKTKKQSSSFDDYLDDLMEQGSRGLVTKNIKNEYDGNIRIRDGKKASKVDRSVMKKINKI